MFVNNLSSDGVVCHSALRRSLYSVGAIDNIDHNQPQHQPMAPYMAPQLV